jgi:hypothetical protein
MLPLYRRLPEELRRCLRPLNLASEVASFLPARPQGRVARLVDVTRRVLRLASTRFSVRVVRGDAPHDGGRLRALLVMNDASAAYWRDVLFPGTPVEQIAGTVSALEAARGTGLDVGEEVDLALSQIGAPLHRLAGKALRVPRLVSLHLDTRRSLDAIVVGEPCGRRGRKADVKRVQSCGLTSRETRDPADYEWFRRALVEPYARQRFGGLCSVPEPHVYRHARRNGVLLLVERDGRAVAGGMLVLSGGEVRGAVLGVDVEARVPVRVALEAVYYHSIAFAVAHGFRRLSFGESRPVLTDGALRYKCKWGGTLAGPVGSDRYVLRYRHTAPVRAALTAKPVVVEAPDGRLGALVGAAGARGLGLARLVEQVNVPGLAWIGLLVDDGTVTGVDDPRVRLVPAGETWPATARLVAAPGAGLASPGKIAVAG